MKYVRGIVPLNTNKYCNMMDFLLRRLNKITTIEEHIRFKEGTVGIIIESEGRKIVTKIEVVEGKNRTTFAETHYVIGKVLGLKKVITKKHIYLINIVREDSDFKIAKTNIHFLLFDCKKKNTTLEDFKNFFNLDDKTNLMKYIFCSLVKINEIDKDLAKSIRNKLDYYGYNEEFYPKFGYTSKEAIDKKSNTDEIIEQCLSVLYYHIEDTDTDEYPNIQNYIYTKYIKFLELLRKEGKLA